MNDFDHAFKQFSKDGNFLKLTCSFESVNPGKFKIKLNQASATLIDNGVLLVEPNVDSNLVSSSKQAVKSIVISAGIHGNETAPIEVVSQLVSEIIRGRLQVRNRFLFIIGNPAAINLGRRFKDQNLNRLFSNKFAVTPDTYEGKRAARLEHYVGDFFSAANNMRFHYDLHAAIRGSRFEKFALYPYRHKKPWLKSQLAFLLACGVNTVLFNHAPNGTFSYSSSHSCAAHAFTIELGKARPLGENDLTELEILIENLRSLIQARQVPTVPFRNADFNLFRVLTEVIKQTDQFRFCIPGDVSNFTEFKSGTLISEDGSERYITQQAGECIIFPNPGVEIGHRAALMVIPTNLSN